MSKFRLIQDTVDINGKEVPVDLQDRVILEFTIDETPISAIKTKSIVELVTLQDTIKDTIDTLKGFKTALEKRYDTLRLSILPEKMDEEEVANITVTGVGRAYIQSDLYFSIPAETKEDAYDWLKDHGHEDIVQETVNSSSGKAWAKQMIKVESQELEKAVMALVDGGMSMNEANEKIPEIHKELVEAGKAIPEGLFKVTPFSRVQITRTKKS